MEGDGSPLSSLCMVRAAELFPKPALEKEDEKLKIPLTELAGESVKYLGRTDDGVLALSNYRLFLLKNSTSSETSVPLGLIESATTRDLFHLIVSCKDASTVKCSFGTSEQCAEWQRRIALSVGVPGNLESLFAFPFYAWASEYPPNNSITDNEWAGRLQRATKIDEDFRKEVKRLEFDVNGTWRISHANADFKLCPSYPRLLLVPCCISDDTLTNVASFRSSRRIPAVVWRHKTSGAVIARCSQPEVGWLGWRNANDEQLLKALVDACAFDKGEQRRRHNLSISSDSVPSSPEGSHEEVTLDEVKKILIVDARSYTSAVTNRARGGGCECAEYYPCADIQFMSLGNIHVIRKSFHALRQLCASPPDIPNWLSLLERTTWFQHMSGLLAASMTVCHAIERNGRPVLVHCSDGWDRTPQIVATSQLCLDPYYRTVEGFRTLVEREWLSFGHKFADRSGHGPGSDESNERCPVFLQWLDCVHQIHRQFPCSFEFSMGYLIKLAQHSHSCIFGTFLCNTVKERTENSVFERTFSVWPFLSGPIYKNPLYLPHRERVLWPAHNVRDLSLWSEVYLGSLGNQQNSSDYPPTTSDINQESKSPMIKTRSYGDLMTVGGNHGGLIRRSSDPNMIGDSSYGLHLQTDPSIETMSDCGITSDQAISAYYGELNNLTEELKQSDNDLDNLTVNNLITSATHHLNKNFQQQHGQQQNNHLDLNSQKCDSKTNKYNLSENLGEIVTNSRSNDVVGVATSSIIDQHDISYNNKYNNESDHESSPFYPYSRSQNVENNFNNIYENELIYENNDDLRTDRRRPSEQHINDEEKEGSIDHVDGVDSMLCPTNPENDLCNTDMLHSITLNDTSQNSSPLQSLTAAQSLWHGSVETSTDTLVPIDQNTTTITNLTSFESSTTNGLTFDSSNSNETNTEAVITHPESIETKMFTNKPNNLSDTTRQMQKNNGTNKIQPEVHANIGGGVKSKYNMFNNQNHSQLQTQSSLPSAYTYNNIMDESIVMQPEHQRMEISNGGCGRMMDNVRDIINTTSSHRRRRNSSNSRQDFSPNKQVNGSISPSATNSRFSTPGVRSLPLTPPGVLERPSVAISCPDGLAHALSEQNLRLQQIVYEHKLREEALQRELYATRLALMKKTTHQCSNNQQNNMGADDPEDVMSVEDFKIAHSDCSSIILGRCSLSPQRGCNSSVSSLIDNIENASVCSWEAVEDRSSVQSSTGGNLAGSVLWVPDHAVSRCTSCQTEFWLGRRKHHCRSCGQIFCADCSEFWAALPDERLYQPVRLCGPCYHNVTIKTQLQQHNRNISLQQSSTISLQQQPPPPQQQNQYHQNINNNSTSMEPCKQYAANVGTSSTIINDRGGPPQSLKATTATN